MLEPEIKVPLAYDADIVVAGGGVTGIFAALASARNGAETVLIDRFGTPGGNIGPGFISGGPICDEVVTPQLLNNKFVTNGDVLGVDK